MGHIFYFAVVSMSGSHWCLCLPVLYYTLYVISTNSSSSFMSGKSTRDVIQGLVGDSVTVFVNVSEVMHTLCVVFCDKLGSKKV